MPNLRSSGPRTAVAPLWQPGAAELIRYTSLVIFKFRGQNFPLWVIWEVFVDRSLAKTAQIFTVICNYFLLLPTQSQKSLDTKGLKVYNLIVENGHFWQLPCKNVTTKTTQIPDKRSGYKIPAEGQEE